MLKNEFASFQKFKYTKVGFFSFSVRSFKTVYDQSDASSTGFSRCKQ